MKPYLITSDLHYHDWHAFAKIDADGVNSRLRNILDASEQAHGRLKRAGGNVSIIAGDVFHVRGNVKPSVLNPVMDHYRKLVDEGFQIYAIPGNHDLESRESSRLGNSITSLESCGVTVAHEPMLVQLDFGAYAALFPWFSTPTDLCDAMKAFRAKHPASTGNSLDAIIHAPIDRVLPSLPDHGLRAEDLATIGFDRVFSGHYHHHKDMGRGVYSIGALTHQTWGDVNSDAGYLIVNESGVHRALTLAPRFVDITGKEDPNDLDGLCAGNYVRVKIEISKDAERQEIIDEFTKRGAAAVFVNAVKITTVTRGVTSTAGGVSIEQSIADYVARKSLPIEVTRLCEEILSQARSAA